MVLSRCEIKLRCELELHMVTEMENTHPFYKQGFTYKTFWQGKSHYVAMLLPMLEQELKM